VQFIKSLDEWSLVQKLKEPYKNYSEFLKINSKAIDNLYGQIRVKEVHFKTKKPGRNC
jgi:hypothetical protein